MGAPRISAAGWRRILGVSSPDTLALLAYLRDQLLNDDDLKTGLNPECRLAGLEALKALRTKPPKRSEMDNNPCIYIFLSLPALTVNELKCCLYIMSKLVEFRVSISYRNLKIHGLAKTIAALTSSKSDESRAGNRSMANMANLYELGFHVELESRLLTLCSTMA
jgi:hypothetical protein